MNRRRFVTAGGACCALGAAQALRAQQEWVMPKRLVRPDVATDEGGLWAIMDREEARFRRSPFVIRDPALRDYVQGIACRLAGNHCPDVRVHLVRTPLFNASMAPNGMMQVWSGLMLRVENEAQLAAIIGHEIGHYVARHLLDQLRDVKSHSAFGQFLGLFGLVGLIAQVGVLASLFSYSRDQERDADRIGMTLMHRAGYDPREASKVWANLLAESKARPESQRHSGAALFATHPAAEERQEVLAEMAKTMPGGVTNRDAWLEKLKPFRREWLDEEIKRGQYEESIVLLTRMIADATDPADFLAARGDVYRLRAKDADLDSALADYRAAVAAGGEPPETHRGLALILRQRNEVAEARLSFQRYIEAAPAAPDTAMIKSYLEELGK